MLKGVKIGIIMILAILIAAGMVLLSTGGIASLIVIAIGYMFLYYTLLLAVVLIAKQKIELPSTARYGLLMFFVMPILWFLVSPDSLGNLLMSGISIDMK